MVLHRTKVLQQCLSIILTELVLEYHFDGTNVLELISKF